MPELSATPAPAISPDNRTGETQRELAAIFRGAGIPSAALDARLLLMHACALTHAEFICCPQRRLTPEQSKRLAEMARRRLRGEPVSRIVGTRSFWSLDFALSPGTLDPRPDTELLVEAVLKTVRRDGAGDAPLRILDLGTGTGCILVSLLRELPAAFGVGTDIGEPALVVARANARRLGVAARASFVRADWLDGMGGPFDIVVANPPYVARGEIAGLSPEVRDHEPVAALDGGPDGLAAYRRILPAVGGVLKSGGILALEVGRGQARAVGAMIARAGLTPDQPSAGFAIRDLAGVERVLLARRPLVERSAKKQLEYGANRASLIQTYAGEMTRKRADSGPDT